MRIEGYQPKTFQERGVAAPFTTPQLVRARFRLSPGKTPPELDLVLPNTTSGRGAYVTSWEEHGAFCRATLYDTFLGEGLAASPDLARLSPATVRHQALEVAARGYAGEEAAQAAARCREAETRRCARIRARLAATLHAPPPAHAERLVSLLADLDPTPEDLGPIPRLLEAVQSLGLALEEWGNAADAGEPMKPVARGIAAAAAALHGGATRMLHAPLALFAQPEGWLPAWVADATAFEAELTRPAWLLDGWERLVLLRRCAGTIHPELVRELAEQLPVLPDEADAWLGLPAGASAQAARRLPPVLAGPATIEEDAAWQIEQILRNERLWRLAT